MTAGRVVVLVEGYDDRSFWSGYLQTVCRCTPSMHASSERRKQLSPGIRNLLKPGKGVYSYFGPAEDRIIRVVPCHEQEGVAAPLWQGFDNEIQGRGTETLPLLGVVVCLDDDGTVGEDSRHLRSDLADRLRRLGEPAVAEEGDHVLRLQDGAVVVGVTWRCARETADDAALLPSKQTLERVVCAALHQVYPQRVQSARDWLAHRPEPTEHGGDHKASAGAMWAGWHAREGWGYFFEGLWQHPEVGQALLDRVAVLRDPSLRGLFQGVGRPVP